MQSDPTGAGAPAATPVRKGPVAYFSMEIALSDSLPVFAGGLGVLAGDHLKAASDLGLPVIGVSLLYRGGYFRQDVDPSGAQRETPVSWRPEDVLERVGPTVEVVIGGRTVEIAAWRLDLAEVPVYFLDTDLPGNDAADREITDCLYGGDREHRLRQEAVLGLGGVRMLSALGHGDVATFHMNEGHSALLTLMLLEESSAPAGSPEAVGGVRERCVFTTHTPVPAGHDVFPAELAREVLGEARLSLLRDAGGLDGDELNMTVLGLRMSRFANGVSQRHGEVARAMFPEAAITSITNGVHAATWAAPPIRELLDRSIPGWRADNSLLRYAGRIPGAEIADAHGVSKRVLVDEVNRRTGTKLDPNLLTLGIARRVTQYKQAMLLFGDLGRLEAIAGESGPLQVICSGKAHPRDEPGRALVADLVRTAASSLDDVDVVFLENYDLGLAGMLCAGSDVWLNTPVRPNEASGTSGMKAALNGVPSLSILDGWWLEGWIEGVTGWAVGDEDGRAEDDAANLYAKLGTVVAPLYYRDPEGFAAVRRNALALNGSFFNTDRMVREYSHRAYGLG